MKKATLYYDGHCNLCSSEIRRLAQYTDQHPTLVDVHSLSVPVKEKETLLRVLHLETSDGRQLRGLDANIAAWNQTPWALVFNLLRLPVIYQVAGLFYTFWADRRYSRLYPRGYSSFISDKEEKNSIRSNHGS